MKHPGILMSLAPLVLLALGCKENATPTPAVPTSGREESRVASGSGTVQFALNAQGQCFAINDPGVRFGIGEEGVLRMGIDENGRCVVVDQNGVERYAIHEEGDCVAIEEEGVQRIAAGEGAECLVIQEPTYKRIVISEPGIPLDKPKTPVAR